MNNRYSALAVCLCLMPLLAAATGAAELPSASSRMTNRVDELLRSRWRQERIEPVERSSDSEFVRRAHLDLVGVVPRSADVRRFLLDETVGKRERLIDQLLDSPRHATHMANTWRQIMLPGGADLEQLQSVAGIQNWLRKQFASNMRYDRLVSDFLVATGGGEAGPALYYTSLELKPEKLAASTSRIFLGLQIECAECHDHPFDHWKQQDFWGYAAFFARLDQSAAMNGPQQAALIDLPEGEVSLPDSENVVLPKYPGGRSADLSEIGTRRVQLAIWMASRDNPFLARAAVNRIWSQLFGRGLVEPVDDLGDHNPASHPQLMDELTEYFVSQGFDIQELLRVLANTDAYQLSSESNVELPGDLFAYMAVKAMTPDQLYDSLARIMASPSGALRTNRIGPGFDPRRIAFASKMRMRGANATEFDAGVLQALTLLNGSEISALTDVDGSGILAALTAPWMSDTDRVEAVILATLARSPSAAESALLVEYLSQSQPDTDRVQRLSDILWALLNSAEFELNH